MVIEKMGKKIELYREMIAGHRAQTPVMNYLHMKIIAVDEGQATFEMQTSPEMINSIGLVQGGILSTVADAAMGLAAGSLLDENQFVTTIELKMNFLRPVKLGKITAIGKVTHPGHHIIFTECQIFTDSQKLAVTGSSTLMIIQS